MTNPPSPPNFSDSSKSPNSVNPLGSKKPKHNRRSGDAKPPAEPIVDTSTIEELKVSADTNSMLVTSESVFGHQPWSHLVRAELGLILDSDVFIRTMRGQKEALERTRELPHRLRMLLMLIDGRRSVGAFRAAMTNYRSLDESLDMLMKMSLIERLPLRLDQ
jgi:hypothetical protein